MSVKRSFYGQKGTSLFEMTRHFFSFPYGRFQQRTRGRPPPEVRRHSRRKSPHPARQPGLRQRAARRRLLARSTLRSTQLLQKETYFGRYGPVCKLILNPPYPNKKGFTYQAYVTYACELDAALAIVVPPCLDSPWMGINWQIAPSRSPSGPPSIAPTS